MKNVLLFLVVMACVFAGCSKENDETTTLTVYAKCKYKQDFYPYKIDTSLISNADIYIYKELNFGLDYINGIRYDYLGNGVLRNKTTGEKLYYWKKGTSTNPTYFEDLPNGTYGVVVDISHLDTEGKIDDWNGISIRIPENLKNYEYNNALNFVFDIWPYSPWELGLK